MNIRAKKYIFQEEIGEENNVPHLQGVVCFMNPVWFKRLKEIDSRVHWEPCRDLKGSIKYCSKPMTRKKGTLPHVYNVKDNEFYGVVRRVYGHDESMAKMRTTMIEDCQRAADKRSKQWSLEWEYQKEWYLEMNKLFGNREIITDMPDN